MKYQEIESARRLARELLTKYQSELAYSNAAAYSDNKERQREFAEIRRKRNTVEAFIEYLENAFLEMAESEVKNQKPRGRHNVFNDEFPDVPPQERCFD